MPQLDALNTRMRNALQKVDGKLADEGFLFLKKDTNKKIAQVEGELSKLSD